MTSSVLVTGAGGFIGQHVVADLHTQGMTLTAVTRREGCSFPADVARLALDLEAPGAIGVLRDALQRVDAVVHLAGRAHLIRDRSADSLDAYRRAHLGATKAVLAATAGTPVRRLVILSTVAAAAAVTPGGTIDDEVEPAPESAYGISKREMELEVMQTASALGIEAVILRPPLVYGPGMKGNPLRLMRLVARRRPIPLSVPPARRSVLYVGNLTQAILLALTTPSLGAGPYFVSDGAAPTTVELIEAMGAALGTRPRLLRVHRKILLACGAAGDLVAKILPFPLTTYEARRLIESVQIESARFWREVGQGPRTSMSAGLGLTARWFQSSGG